MDEPLSVLTVDDFVRTGACRGGVLEIRNRFWPDATAVATEEVLAKLKGEHRRYAERAAGRDGDGYGDGYGYGYGDGDGYGDGKG